MTNLSTGNCRVRAHNTSNGGVKSFGSYKNDTDDEDHGEHHYKIEVPKTIWQPVYAFHYVTKMGNNNNNNYSECLKGAACITRVKVPFFTTEVPTEPLTKEHLYPNLSLALEFKQLKIEEFLLM